MTQGTILPAIIKAQYDPGNAFGALVQEARRASGDARQAFEKDFADIGRIAQQALSVPRNAAGALDLNAGNLREAAADANAYAQALREVTAAALAEARAVGDTSEETRRYIQSARAATAAAEGEARELTQQAALHERLQAQLNETASATNRLVAVQGAGAAGRVRNVQSIGAERAAFVQLGQQLNDVTVQAQMGTSAFTIFAQQVPQAAFALSGLSNSANATKAAVGSVATFLSGPWGAAIFAATAVLGPYIAELLRTRDALDETGDAAEEAVKKMFQSLNQASSFSDALNEVAKKRVGALGELAKVNRRIADEEASFAALSRTFGGGEAAASVQSGLGRLYQERARLQGQLQEASSELLQIRTAAQARNLQEAAQDRLDALDEKPRKTRTRRSGTSAAERQSKRDAAEAQRAQDMLDRQADAVRSILTDQERQLAVQSLTTQGREEEAELLELSFRLMDAVGAKELEGLQAALAKAGIREDELADLRENLGLIRAGNAAQERAVELREREAELVRQTSDNLRSTMQDLARGGGVGAIGSLFKRQFDMVLERQVDDLFESLFGAFFKSEHEAALRKPIEAREAEAVAIGKTVTALDTFTAALGKAANFELVAGEKVPPIPRLGQAANDNGGGLGPDGEIVVVANKSEASTVPMMAPRDFLGAIVTKVADVFVDPRTAERIGKGFSDGLSGQGAAYGALAGGFAFGNSGSPLLSAAGGALGERFLAKPLSKGLESIAKGLGDFAGPLGSILGGLAGGLLGSLMTSTPRASTTIGAGADGKLAVVSTRGNSAQFRRASEGSAGEALDTLDRIAEALGATINAANGSVSIGVRKGSYRVDTTGSGITKTSRGAIDFGEDSAAAIRAATMDLIKDGVLQGLKDSTRRLLQGASDLDKAIKDALDFEGVFTRLKEIKDPVGAALDALNKDFERLIGLFQRAGASTSEFAALEELYGLERARAIKDASESMVAPLRDLIASMETGDRGLSLRSRLVNARAAYDPLAEAVRAGQTIDYSEFTAAAETMLSISRELFGSQAEYFATFDEILGLSKQALAGRENIISIADASPSPFVNVDTVPVVQAVDAQSQMLLQQLTAANGNLQTLIDLYAAANNAPAVVNGTYF
jgi:hypothetical protein